MHDSEWNDVPTLLLYATPPNPPDNVCPALPPLRFPPLTPFSASAPEPNTIVGICGPVFVNVSCPNCVAPPAPNKLNTRRVKFSSIYSVLKPSVKDSSVDHVDLNMNESDRALNGPMTPNERNAVSAVKGVYLISW